MSRAARSLAVGVALAAVLAVGCHSSPLSRGDGGVGSGGATAGDTGANGTAGTGGTDTGGASGATAGASGSGGTAGPGPLVQEISWSGGHDLDLLFMIDDSASMAPLQHKLIANFPAFMDVLKALPLPNVHIAVVSSDLGAGRTGALPACTNTGGDQGKFQFAPKDATVCANAHLQAGQTFLSNVNGMANYTGDISDAFSCIAALGQSGCGLEHQFGSVLRALGADGHGGAPLENTGFLRSNAYLGVILVTNEDDCSAPIGSDLFTDTSKYVSDPLGPLTSYRCNYVGHLCDGQPLPKSAGGPYQSCVSKEDGVLLKVSDVVAGLKGLKADPNKILVSALAGPPQPYSVTKTGVPNNDDVERSWPEVAHSCTQSDGTYADPGVRIWQFTQAFAGNGVFESICNASFTPALQRIAEELGQKVASYQCLAMPGPRGDCTFVDHAFDVTGTHTDTPVPACAKNGGASPCWELVADARCGAGRLVNVHRATGVNVPESTTVTCQP
jgi:hypothetical protein